MPQSPTVDQPMELRVARRHKRQAVTRQQERNLSNAAHSLFPNKTIAKLKRPLSI